MFKSRIIERLRKYFGEYLFAFDENYLSMSLLKGSVNLKNVNIRPDKINEIFQE